MRYALLPKLFILFLISSAIPAITVFGQSKPAGEADISKCWTYLMADSAGENIAADGNRVFVGSAGAKIEALSFDGKKMWSSEFGGSVNSNLLPLDNGLFVVTSTVSSEPDKPAGSMLRVLSKETGIISWTLKLPEASSHFLIGFNGSLIVVSKNGVIQSIDAGTGSLKWKREIADGFVAEPVSDGGRIMVATTGKQIFLVQSSSGQIESLTRSSFNVTAIGIDSDVLLVGDERGNLSLFVNGSDKASWKFKAGGEISSVTTVGDHFLVTSHDNFVYFLGRSNGGVAWKKRLSGRISQIANYMGRYGLFASVDGHGLILTDLSNGKVAGQIVLDENESVVYAPVAANGQILILTNRAIYAYSLNGCPEIKNDGPGNTPPAAI